MSFVNYVKFILENEWKEFLCSDENVIIEKKIFFIVRFQWINFR